MTAQENLKNNYIQVDYNGFTFWVSKSLLWWFTPKGVLEGGLETHSCKFIDLGENGYRK